MTKPSEKTIDYASHKVVKCNKVEYHYLESGQGPTLFLLHGYPDNAYSWEHQIRFLSAQGYRVIAPFLRGYAPTVTPKNSYFDRATLAIDVACLIKVLNDGEPIYLVGQDWGAAISWGILGAYPELIKRCVILAIPHPVEVKRTLKTSLRHCIRSFHWFLFQIPWLPEFLIRRGNGAFLKFLWRLWSPNFNDKQHVDELITLHIQDKGIPNTLAYYRAAMQKKYRDPALSKVFSRLDNQVNVPTKVICGQQDMRKELLPRQQDLLAESAQYQWELVDNAGHFLHREQPKIINEAILEWLSA